jgi:hypothetical protein
MLSTRQRSRSYRCVHFLLSSISNFTTDSEEKDHGYTRQEVSQEVWQQHQQQALSVEIALEWNEVGKEVGKEVCQEVCEEVFGATAHGEVRPEERIGWEKVWSEEVCRQEIDGEEDLDAFQLSQAPGG